MPDPKLLAPFLLDMQKCFPYAALKYRARTPMLGYAGFSRSKIPDDRIHAYVVYVFQTQYCAPHTQNRAYRRFDYFIFARAATSTLFL